MGGGPVRWWTSGWWTSGWWASGWWTSPVAVDQSGVGGPVGGGPDSANIGGWAEDQSSPPVRQTTITHSHTARIISGGGRLFVGTVPQNSDGDAG